MKPHRRISVIEIAVLLGVIATVIAIFLPAIATTGHHHGTRQLKDAAQLRGIQTAMIMWANEHHDVGPPVEAPASPESPK